MGWLDKLFTRRPPTAPTVVPDPIDEAWRAAEPRLRAAYGDQAPFLYGAAVLWEDGGPDPLRAVAIYWSGEGPHWHYVSSGLAVAGLELTFRLAAAPDRIGTEPSTHLGAIAYNAPTWPVSMLNMLARRVLRTGRPFGHGHWWQGPPGALRPHCGVEHLAFADDPTLAAAPPGAVRWLQAVGVTPATVEAMQADERAGRGDATLDALRRADPWLITDAARFP